MEKKRLERNLTAVHKIMKVIEKTACRKLFELVSSATARKLHLKFRKVRAIRKRRNLGEISLHCAH